MKIKLPSISIPPKLTSRKLWLAIISALIPVLNAELGWGLDEDVIMKVIGSLWIFIVVEGGADIATRLNSK